MPSISVLIFSVSAFAEKAFPDISADNSFLKNRTVKGCEHQEGYPPFIFENSVSGKLEGYSVEVLNLVFKDSGAETEYRLLPWLRCMAYMDKGEDIDIVLAAASTEERRGKYIFSDPFAEVHLAYFYDQLRYPDGLNIESPGDFESLNVCGMRGWVYENYGLSNEIIQASLTFQQVVRMVVKKRCDAFLVRYEVFKSLRAVFPGLEHYGRMKGGIIPWKKDDPIKFYFLAKRNSDYHRQLIEYINKGLKQIEKSGQLREIREKYGFASD